MRELLKAENIWFRYEEGEYLLKGIDFSLMESEVIGIMGESGCGKTTLCHCLSGIIPKIYQGDFSGAIALCGQPMDQWKRSALASQVGVVFQDPDTQLFSDIIEEDVAFGPENLCLPWDEMDDSVRMALEDTKLSQYRLDSARTLSGGQRQLAAVASVLTLNPKVLIFDEAMAQLDETGKEMILETVTRLRAEGKGIILIEHDRESLKIADKILTLEKGQWV